MLLSIEDIRTKDITNNSKQAQKYNVFSYMFTSAYIKIATLVSF